MIALNRGGIDGLRRSPRIKFDTGEAEDLTAYAEALPKLVGVGFKVPRSWAQEKLRIPEPQDGDDTLGSAGAPGGAKDGSPTQPPPKVAANAAGLPEADPVEAITERLVDAADQPWGAVLDQVRRLVEQAESLDTLQAALVQGYGGLPTAKLTAIMTLALASAELAGMADVVDGR